MLGQGLTQSVNIIIQLPNAGTEVGQTFSLSQEVRTLRRVPLDFGSHPELEQISVDS